MFSRASLFIKRLYNIFLLTFIMFKHFKVGKYLEHMRQKLSKNLPIFNFFTRMNCFPSFFLRFFILGSHFIPVFLTGISSSGDKISSKKKRVNNKRQFTLENDDFIPEPVSSRDQISCLNTP